MRDGRNVFNHRDAETCTSQRTKRRLTTGSWTVHKDTDLLHAMIHGLFSGVSGHKLGCEGSGLTRALKALSTCGRLGNHVTLYVRDRDDRIVERRVYVRNTIGDVLTFATT